MQCWSHVGKLQHGFSCWKCILTGKRTNFPSSSQWQTSNSWLNYRGDGRTLPPARHHMLSWSFPVPDSSTKKTIFPGNLILQQGNGLYWSLHCTKGFIGLLDCKPFSARSKQRIVSKWKTRSTQSWHEIVNTAGIHMGLKRKTSATTTAFPNAHSCLLFFPRSSHPRAGCRLSRQLHNPVVLWLFSTHSGQMMRQTLPTENTCWQKLNHSSALRSLMTCAHAGFRCSC